MKNRNVLHCVPEIIIGYKVQHTMPQDTTIGAWVRMERRSLSADAEKRKGLFVHGSTSGFADRVNTKCARSGYQQSRR